jgi:hypothetical protein
MNTLKMALQPGIPTYARVFGWILAIAGVFFAYVYTINPSGFFPGVSITSYSEHFGLYSTGVRILGAVLGILVALILDSAALFAAVLVTRIFIELGDVVVGLVINHGTPDTNTATLLGLAAIEVFFAVKLTQVVLHSSRQ